MCKSNVTCDTVCYSVDPENDIMETIVLYGDKESIAKLREQIDALLTEQEETEEPVEKEVKEETKEEIKEHPHTACPEEDILTEECQGCEFLDDCLDDLRDSLINEVRDAAVEEDPSMNSYYAEIGRKVTELIDLIF